MRAVRTLSIATDMIPNDNEKNARKTRSRTSQPRDVRADKPPKTNPATTATARQHSSMSSWSGISWVALSNKPSINHTSAKAIGMTTKGIAAV